MFTLILLAGTSQGASRHSRGLSGWESGCTPHKVRLKKASQWTNRVTHHANAGRESVRRERVWVLSHFSCVQLRQAPLCMGFSRQELKWAAMPSSRGSSQPRDQTHVSYVSSSQAGSLWLVPEGKPLGRDIVNKFAVSPFKGRHPRFTTLKAMHQRGRSNPG